MMIPTLLNSFRGDYFPSFLSLPQESLKPIRFEIFSCMCQVFEYYFLTSFSMLGHISASSLPYDPTVDESSVAQFRPR